MSADQVNILTIGGRIKFYRKKLKCSQDSLAQSIGVKTETLRHFEKGRSAPRINDLSAIANELGVKLSTLISSEFQMLHDIDAIPWQLIETVDSIRLAMSEALNMNRRSTLEALTTVVISGPALLSSLEPWLYPYVPGHKSYVKDLPMGKLSLDETERLHQAVVYFRHWVNDYGDGPCRKAAVALLHEVTAALQERQTEKVKTALCEIMADLSNIIATMTWQSGHERLAQDYYKLALRGAHISNNNLVGARILVGMSRQMLYQGKVQDALDLVQLAQYGSRHSAGPQVKAMLFIREAWALSALGQEAGFQRASALAYEQAAKAKLGQEPDWAESFSNDSELAGVMGSGFTELAKHNPQKYAEQASEQAMLALELRGSAANRYTALEYAGIAENRFLLGDFETAVHYTEKTLDICQHLHKNCAQVHKHLISLHGYSKNNLYNMQVREINTRLENLLANV